MDNGESINDPSLSPGERLAALAQRAARGGFPPAGDEVNNHIHTVYSFSPYTPAMAALRAREAGLSAAGSVDHDSTGAAAEMLASCALLGMGCCTGFELRVSFRETGRFADRKLNNPDSRGLCYMTVQGIPVWGRAQAEAFLAPLRAERNRRNRAMLESLNVILHDKGLPCITFEGDVLPLTQAGEGGSVTERHLLLALSRVLTGLYGRGPALVVALGSVLAIPVPSRTATLLSQNDNPHYLYDLLGLLKSSFLERVFIQPSDRECPPAREAVELALAIGAIPAYAYLGDVEDSPTGDKRAEAFEDSYLEELFGELSRTGFQAVTYMPPRNSLQQLLRVQSLCQSHGMMEISGVDINSSRQSFNCPQLKRAEFRHLFKATWALVAHEALSSADRSLGLFSADNPLAALSLGDRIERYAEFGRSLDLFSPARSAGKLSTTLLTGSLTT